MFWCRSNLRPESRCGSLQRFLDHPAAAKAKLIFLLFNFISSPLQLVNEVDELLLQSFGFVSVKSPQVYTFYTQIAYDISALSRTLTLVTSFLYTTCISNCILYAMGLHLRTAIALPVMPYPRSSNFLLSAVSVSYSFTVNGLQFNGFW